MYDISEYGGFFGVFFGTRNGVKLVCVAYSSGFGYRFFGSHDTYFGLAHSVVSWVSALFIPNESDGFVCKAPSF